MAACSNKEFFSKLEKIIEKSKTKGTKTLYYTIKRVKFSSEKDKLVTSKKKNATDLPNVCLIRVNFLDKSIRTYVTPEETDNFLSIYNTMLRSGMSNLKRQQRIKKEKNKTASEK